MYNVKKEHINDDLKKDNKKPMVVNSVDEIDSDSLKTRVHTTVHSLQFVHSDFNTQLTTIDKERAEEIVEKDFLKKLTIQKKWANLTITFTTYLR